MKKAMFLMVVAALLISLSGCCADIVLSPELRFYDRAHSWQMREEDAEERLEGSRYNMMDLDGFFDSYNLTYVAESGDHWATAAEVEERGLWGDCEDLAHFMYREVRENYNMRDSNVRMVVLRVGSDLDDYHICMRINTTGGWRFYDPMNGGLDLSVDYSDVIIEYNLFDIWA